MSYITVFTPTYNRGYIIRNLYNSLCRQSFHDFEWLVIDDGSTDETEILFQHLISKKNFFQIRYIKQQNGGKCRAINKALDYASGKVFFIVDSDDYLTDDALEKIVKWEGQLPKTGNYCGLAGNLGTSKYITPNSIFSSEYYDGNLLDRYKNVDGERAIVFYTDVHRKYRYPEFPGEKFMTEAVAYNRMANDGYKMRFFNDIICIYQYMDDGLTRAGNKLFIDNPHGYGLWVREKAKFQKCNKIQWIKICYAFVCELLERYNPNVIADCLDVSTGFVSLLILIHKVLYTIKG